MSDMRISADFTIEDIHKIREQNHIVTKDMNTQDMKKYYKDSADIVQEHVNKKRSQKQPRQT